MFQVAIETMGRALGTGAGGGKGRAQQRERRDGAAEQKKPSDRGQWSEGFIGVRHAIDEVEPEWPGNRGKPASPFFSAKNRPSRLEPCLGQGRLLDDERLPPDFRKLSQGEGKRR
jgi:hypothetical protein